MSLGSDFVCVVQLTDSHLFADAEGDLLGLQTQASLDAVVDMVLEQISRMDLVLATGDITQDGSEAAYRRFIASSLRLPAPCYWIPGNHDDAELMARLGKSLGLTRDWVDIGNWRIVLLDSSILGAVPGHLSQATLNSLDDALDGADDGAATALGHRGRGVRHSYGGVIRGAGRALDRRPRRDRRRPGCLGRGRSCSATRREMRSRRRSRRASRHGPAAAP